MNKPRTNTPAPIRLDAGGTLTITAGGHRLQLVRDSRGHMGIMDDRGAWCPPLGDDTPTRYSFEVQPENPAYTDGGQGAGAIRQGADTEPIDADTGSARQLLEYAIALSRLHPLFPSLLLLKLMMPQLGIRELARKVTRSKTQTAELLRQLALARPNLKHIAEAGQFNILKAQRRRRRREAGRDGK
jgi:CheY-like chemotaxis protein